MEKKSMGTFLAALRKANGMTQQDVADKLNVSNKTISKWECDDGCPEVMMLPAIAELFNVTVDEILRGERINNKTKSEVNTKSIERIKLSVGKSMLKLKNATVICSVICGIALIVLIFLFFFTNYIVIVISFALSISALLIQIIVANNTLFEIRSGDTDAYGFNLTDQLNTVYKRLSIVICLFIVCLLVDIVAIYSFWDYIFVIIPVSIPIACIASFIVFIPISKPLKRYIYNNAEPQLADKKQLLILKEIKKRVFIVSIIVLVLSFGLPFVQSAAEIREPKQYYFNVVAAYEKCKKLYEKHKGYIIEQDDNSDEKGYSIKVRDLFSNKSQYIAFNTKNELNLFENEYVLSLVPFIPALAGDCSFDDIQHEVIYYKDFTTEDVISNAYSILPIYLMLGSLVEILAAGISYNSYQKKLKKI